MTTTPAASTPDPAREVRIGLCSDTHYWPGGENRHLPDGRVQWQEFSQRIQRALLSELSNANLDLILHLGDVTCGGGSYMMPDAVFYSTLNDTQREFAALAAPVHALPGNHDCPPGGGDWSYFEKLWGMPSQRGKTLDLAGVRLVLLNAQGHSSEQIARAQPGDPIYGWVSDAELARLDADLARSDGPVLLFVHQLLRPWSGHEAEWQEYYRVENAAAVLDVLARHGNVRAVFQGHAHMYDVQTVQLGGAPCTFVVTPAIIEYPMAWLAMTVSGTTLRITYQPLPLPELTESFEASPHAWRSGLDQWHDFTVELA
jgi:3',5'-cyclic AMP phosphodiesterase CpdA